MQLVQLVKRFGSAPPPTAPGAAAAAHVVFGGAIVVQAPLSAAQAVVTLRAALDLLARLATQALPASEAASTPAVAAKQTVGVHLALRCWRHLIAALVALPSAGPADRGARQPWALQAAAPDLWQAALLDTARIAQRCGWRLRAARPWWRARHSF